MKATTDQYRLGFIGAGKLAGSIIRGLVRAKFCSPAEILASEPYAEARETLQRELGISVTTENAEVAEKGETILIGVKPGLVSSVVGELAALIADKQVISLAAGVRVASMEAKANARFMRAMTNTPSAICQSSHGDRARRRALRTATWNLLAKFLPPSGSLPK